MADGEQMPWGSADKHEGIDVVDVANSRIDKHCIGRLPATTPRGHTGQPMEQRLAYGEQMPGDSDDKLNKEEQKEDASSGSGNEGREVNGGRVRGGEGGGGG